MTEKMFAPRRAGDGVAYHEAGAGETPVVAILGTGEAPTRAHALLAERRRVVVFAPPPEAGAAHEAAQHIGATLASLGIKRYDLIGEGAGAATALWLALGQPKEIGAVVLAAPDGSPDDAFREMTRPVLVLAGTRDASAAADRCRALLPECHLMLVYDAGVAIGAERPEALAFIAQEFFERRGLFLVSRESGKMLP
jgi:pimeloyl-ACP methyl ester carboxylesterase